MKCIVDAHLPRRLARLLAEAGHDAIHTLDLPGGNATPDSEIVALAARDSRIVITKDADFVVGHTLGRRPRQLLLIATGNIGNRELERLFLANLEAIANAFAQSSFVELRRDQLRQSP